MKPRDQLVLVAEDSRTEAEGLRALLEREGYTVEWAADGRQALELAQRRQPSVIISDIVMPEMDGYSLCQAVKADRRLASVPVLLVTTLSEPSDVIRGLECGADHFVRKPYQGRYLLSRLTYLLANRALREEQRMQMGVELSLGGKTYFISSERRQILDLLISTYEQAVDLNSELMRKQREVTQANQVLARQYAMAWALNRAASVSEVIRVATEQLSDVPGVRSSEISVHDGYVSGPAAGVREPVGAGGSLAARGRGEVRLPLSSGGDAIGSMGVVWSGGAWDKATHDRLDALADQVAVALDRARLHESLEKLVEDRTAALKAEIQERERQEAKVTRLNRFYSVLSGINTTIVRVRTRQELFERACQTAVVKGGFAFAWIGTFSPRSNAMTPAARAGGDDRFDVLVDRGATQRAAVSAGFAPGPGADVPPFVCDDIATDDRHLPWRDEALALGCRSAIVLPLRSGSRVVGAFTLFAAETGVFDVKELSLLAEIAADVSFALDHLKQEEQLRELAYVDRVVALPNAAFLLERLRGWRETPEPANIAVIVVGLDRFQAINYSLGNTVGDDLLRTVAHRLSEVVDGAGIVARLRGDKFAVALRGVSASSADAFAERIIEALSTQFAVDEHELFPGPSVGIAVGGSEQIPAETLVYQAETAMYRARQDRPGGYLVHSAKMSAEADERLELESALRNAVGTPELALHYQPIVDLATRRLASVEALARWNRPGIGLVSPGKFIPVAEETGLITELGEWVLETACTQAWAWNGEGGKRFRVAVNLSARQFHQPDLYERVMAIIRRTGVDPSLLTFEITESHLMRDVEATRAIMSRFVGNGVQFSIDDFGTGYSSLAYISRLPINSLKIDRSFVRHVGMQGNDDAIVVAMLSMANSLGLRVVAEGVETKEQVDFLEALGCDAAQGYYFGRPMPAEKLDGFRVGPLGPAPD